MNSTKIVLLLVIIGCCYGCKMNIQYVPENITGTWVSTEDSGYRMIISKDSIQEYYGGELTSRFAYTIQPQTCDTNYSGQQGIYLYKQNSNENYCYEITTCSSRHLAYIYTLRGNKLFFTRKQDK